MHVSSAIASTQTFTATWMVAAITGHAPFLHFYFPFLEKLSICIRVPNFNFVALLVLEIYEGGGGYAKFHKGH